MSHLTETQLQGLADGTLRGPEGLAAREHCETCASCDAELSAYGALVRTLSTLQDPPPPLDFTASVLAAVEVRETQLSQRRHTLLASLPAAAMAIFAIAGWALSTSPAAHVDRLVDGVTVLRHLMGVLTPVFNAMRLPLGLGAFVFLAVVLTALSRTLRPIHARAATGN
jgi:anti-sigma factor RsiW